MALPEIVVGGVLARGRKILVVYRPEYLVLLAELCYRMICLCWWMDVLGEQ